MREVVQAFSLHLPEKMKIVSAVGGVSIPPVEVNGGPLLDNVYEGKDVDITKIHSELERQGVRIR